jgi:hypothetical protein
MELYLVQVVFVKERHIQNSLVDDFNCIVGLKRGF